MKLDLFRNIDKESFGEDYKELMEKLAPLLNNNFINLYDALTNNLTIKDNFKGTELDINVKVNSSGAPITGDQFRITLAGQVSGMKVTRAICTDNVNTYPLSHPFISFTQNGNIVTIKNITGLQPNTLYQLKVEISGQ